MSGNYYVIEISSNGKEKILSEFSDLLDAMQEQKKLRKKIPEDSCVMIQEKATYKFLQKHKKKQRSATSVNSTDN